jgi:hypothetical protein
LKIITCAGYHSSGSSAITDLLGEFDNCYSLGNYEFRFIQDPNGISDLDFNLVENNHRLNSSYALKKFKQLVDFYSGNKIIPKYEKYFNNCFKKISYEYIEELTGVKFRGIWSQDIIDKGKLFFYIYGMATVILRFIMRRLTGRGNIKYTVRINETMRISNPREKFYDLTRDYIFKLFTVANKYNKEFLIVDQLVPPSNTSRYLKYFYDLKIISVDRDPRDLYLLSKIYWKDNVIPKEIDDFIEWFKITRSHRKYDQDESNNVLRIRFEELIYEYDDTLKKISVFLGLDLNTHIYKKKFFIPEIAQLNTNVWINHKEYSADVIRIQNELKEFCYER